MFALDVELLTGRYIATAYNDRAAAEWPPHPARLYSALVEAHHAGDGAEEERRALDWLEAQDPPHICSSDAHEREVVTHFVPVNDTSVLADQSARAAAVDELDGAVRTLRRELDAAEGDKQAKKIGASLTRTNKKLDKARERLTTAIAKDVRPYDRRLPASAVADARGLLPENRLRQPRTFPSVTPDDPLFSMVWPDAEPTAALSAALDRVAARIVRLGHSASFVSVKVSTDRRPSSWVPDAEGKLVLRTVGAGQRASLEECFERHRAILPRVLPCEFQRYGASKARPAPDMPHSVFDDDWLILARAEGAALMTRTVDVARAIRGAVMSHASQPPSEILSGHDAAGQPSERPHLAIVPLPFVGSKWADGSIVGVALIFPRDASRQERVDVYRALAAWESVERRADDDRPRLPVRMGRAGELRVERLEADSLKSTLRPPTWCRPATRWTSATPVALDRNPGNLRAREPDQARAAYEEAARTIALACTRIGLPAPVEVTVRPSTGLSGSRKARAFGPFPRDKNKTRRVLAHATITFEKPVAGPIVIGAGRYRGLGLFRPIEETP